MACEIEPHIRLYVDSVEPAWDSLSLSLWPSPTHTVFVSLKINKYTEKFLKSRGTWVAQLVKHLTSAQVIPHGS